MIDIAERLSKARLPVQLILICGHNDELLQRLRARTFDIPVFIEGFTNSITHYMHLSDFFIGKTRKSQHLRGIVNEAAFGCRKLFLYDAAKSDTIRNGL